ncbi:MAG: serpin family protein [Silvibacterium sp.]|nr:serpin family protein [Silvibacterium sp.]MBV8438681.1 serpin family protein [Silvibacterium sp.]
MRWLLALTVLFMARTSALPDQTSTDAARALAQPYAQVGFEVLRDVTAEHPHSNAFISPTSIAVALAMTANGAEGATRDAILSVLHTRGQSTAAFNAANRALAEEIGNTAAVQLSIANAIWVQEGIPIEPAFRQVLESEYLAAAENLDFRTPAAANTINAWVAKHTNDRIKKLLDNIDPATVTMLTNAIAFKGKWTAPFDAKNTQPHDFKTAAGQVRKVPMMKRSGQYSYSNANGLESIQLPYADGTFAMYVVLPQDETRMRSFLDQLTPGSFTTLTSSLTAQKGTIELPRFTLEYSATLNSILRKLGMGPAFDTGANFQGINKMRPLQISEVRHASFLRVDEEGTEAAAATGVGIRAAAVRVEPPPFHMVVDHPFFLAIRDERNGQVLFTGMIANPES